MKLGGLVRNPLTAINHPTRAIRDLYDAGRGAVGKLRDYGMGPGQVLYSGGWSPLAGAATRMFGEGDFDSWEKRKKRSFQDDPEEAFKDFWFYAGDPGSGILTSGFDKMTGGSGTYNSAAQNRWIHGIGGAALSYFTPYGFAAPFIGQGISALGRGDGEDQSKAGTYAGLGALIGGAAKWGQGKYQNWGDAGAGDTTGAGAGVGEGTGASEGAASSVGTSSAPNSTNVAVNFPSDPSNPYVTTGDVGVADQNVAVPWSQSYSQSGDFVDNPVYTSDAGNVAVNFPSDPGNPYAANETGNTEQPSAYPVGGRSFPRTGGTTMVGGSGNTGGGGMNSYAGLGMAAKAGLGWWQNYQQQKAVEDELKDRERIRNLQLAAMNDPMAVPGMRARRALGQKAFDAKYRARYGGAEGGAYDKGMARYMDSVTSSGVNDYVNTLGGIGAQTQPAMMINAQAGGTPLGAAAGPASQAISDYMLMQWWQQAMGGQP